MNQQTMQGNWNQIKGKIKERWGALTDDELDQADGDVDQLLGTIQEKTGESRESIEHYLDQICSGECDSQTREAIEAARQYAQEAAETVQASTKQVADAMKDGYKQTEQVIKSKPVESLAVTFGAGMVAGLVMGVLIRSR